MNYEFILKDIRPNKEEIDSVSKTAHKILDFLNETCRKENIPAKAMFVGSFSKKTWLSGKSDIDIFIHFPLDADIDFLKEKGLYLGYKTSDYFNGTPSEHFASHPYLTSEIDGIEVDFVPCYLIKDASTGQYFTPDTSNPISKMSRLMRFFCSRSSWTVSRPMDQSIRPEVLQAISASCLF